MSADPADASTPRSPPRLTAKGAATRQRIVDAATDLIAAHGVAGMSVEQIRDRADVSGSQLYHYFDSKQSLVRAVIAQQAEAAAHDSALQDGALDSFQALRAWAEATLERQAAVGTRQCDLTTLAGELSNGDEAARDELVNGFNRWREALRSGLSSMQTSGVLSRSADLDELTAVLLTALQGGSQLASALGDLSLMQAALRGALSYVESFAAPGA